MKISNKGLELIKRHEGVRMKAYRCPAGVWTIGYGHTHQVKRGDEIDANMAHEFLKKDVRHAQNAIEKYVKVALEQHQFDALVSFIFNVGAGNFRKSTLLKMLNKGNYENAEGQFKRWNKARVKGVLKPLRGLTRRRNDEAELFSNYDLDDIPQAVAEPVQKTMLKSKTNITSIVGVGGLCATQLDSAKKLLDGVNDVTAKGGDIADHLGGVLGGMSLQTWIIIGLVGAFIYVMIERKRKIDQHGL